MNSATSCKNRSTVPLTDGSRFPFGHHYRARTKMMDVKLSFYRNFLQQPWAPEWPNVVAYANERLADERAAKKLPRKSEAPRAPIPRSDPAAAAAALADLQKLKASLTGPSC